MDNNSRQDNPGRIKAGINHPSEAEYPQRRRKGNTHKQIIEALNKNKQCKKDVEKYCWNFF